MKLEITLRNEAIDMIVLSEEGKNLYVLTVDDQPGLSLIALLDNKLVHLNILRYDEASDTAVSDYTDAMATISKLMLEQGHVFEGQFWGTPVATFYIHRWWFGVSNKLIISYNGQLSPQALSRNASNVDVSSLVQHARKFIDIRLL